MVGSAAAVALAFALSSFGDGTTPASQVNSPAPGAAATAPETIVAHVDEEAHDLDGVVPPPPIGAWGIGAATFGLSPAEVGARLGVDLVAEAGYEAFRAEHLCGHLSVAEPGFEGVSFMVTGEGDGVVNRIDVVDGPWRTDRGVGIGSTRDEVLATLGDEHLMVVDDPYAVEGEWLVISEDDRHEQGVEVYVLDASDVVHSFRVGAAHEAGLQEGCV